MENRVGLKELRQNVAKYAKKVQTGQSFIIMKHSKPLFKITPVDNDERWEEVVDFTKIKRGGVDVDDLLSRL
jgi:prevent-host-death family protein